MSNKIIPLNAVPNQFVLEKDGVSLWIKREDQLHSEVSGNKFRKTKYNLEEAVSNGYRKILTFGGAYSNHIAATAAAGELLGLETIGVIRGEELERLPDKELRGNPTLDFALDKGMKLKFLSREEYRKHLTEDLLHRFSRELGPFYYLPEGGTNSLGVQGCEEILTPEDREQFDVICCSVGTGGTMAGLINASGANQRVLGFSALKGNFPVDVISQYTKKSNWDRITNYHFGGYAKINEELIHFMNNFKTETGIPLDPVYTGKMIFGIFDLLAQGWFRANTRILAVHTGGLQGIAGMNRLLKRKRLPQIQ